MLAETGYDPRGLKRVLGRLTKGDHSHGDPATRAKAVEDEAFKLEPVPRTLAARSKRLKVGKSAWFLAGQTAACRGPLQRACSRLMDASTSSRDRLRQ